MNEKAGRDASTSRTSHRARADLGALEEPVADQPRTPGPVGNFFHSVTTLFANLMSAAHTRLELVTTEIQEEIHRTAEVLIWAFVGLAATGIALLLAALTIIFAFWDDHRILVSVLVTAFFCALAVAAGLVVTGKVRSKPKLLASTLNELRKDSERLREAL